MMIAAAASGINDDVVEPPTKLRSIRLSDTGCDCADPFRFLSQPSCHIEKLDLSTWMFLPESATSLTNALSSNTSLQSLKLNHFFVPTPMLTDDSNRRVLVDLAANIVLACAENDQMKLKKLCLSHMNITDETTFAIAMTKILPKLEILDLTHFPTSAAAAAATNGLAADQQKVHPVIDALTKAGNDLKLKSLILSQTPLSEGDISCLVDVLDDNRSFKSLERLDLEYCSLTEKSLSCLISNIGQQCSSQLQRLSLTGNKLSQHTMKKLSEAVERNIVLQDLGMLSTCIITPQQQERQQQQQQQPQEDDDSKRHKELIEFYLDCNWAGRKVYQQVKNNNHIIIILLLIRLLLLVWYHLDYGQYY